MLRNRHSTIHAFLFVSLTKFNSLFAESRMSPVAEAQTHYKEQYHGFKTQCGCKKKQEHQFRERTPPFHTHTHFTHMKKAGQKERVTSSDVESAVLLWFAASSKPATVQSLVDALQSRFSKPNVQKALDALYERGDIQAKDFKKVRLFFAKRQLPSESSESLNCDGQQILEPVQTDIVEMQRRVNDASRSLDELTSSLVTLGSLPPLDVLQSKLDSLREESSNLSNRLEALQASGESSDVDPLLIVSIGLKRVQHWRERKQIAETLLEGIGECESLCLEMDTVQIRSCSMVLSKLNEK